MTRERAAELWPIIKAYGEGKRIEYFAAASEKWIDVENDPMRCGFVASDGIKYRIKPESKMRPMTRGEVLYMVTTTPGMVVRFGTNYDPMPASAVDLGLLVENYEYAKIDESGEPIDGWHKFEKEVSE